MRNFIIVTSAALMTLSASAYAQGTVVIQNADPMTTQSTVVVPGEVRTYVLEQQVPSVAYEGEVIVGEPVPDMVELHTVDGHSDYAYAIVNERRVIVNPQTRTVVQVLE